MNVSSHEYLIIILKLISIDFNDITDIIKATTNKWNIYNCPLDNPVGSSDNER